MHTNTDLKKGSIFTVTIEKTVYQGQGLAQKDGLKIFIPNTLPGDEVEILLITKKKDYAEGKVINFITKSKNRTTSPCPHFPSCGGCQFIDVDYDKQLELKTEIINDCLKPVLEKNILKPIIACASPYFYRNKMEFAFGQSQDEITLGLKKRGTFSHIIPVSNCKLQSQLSNKIVQETVTFFKKTPLKNWNYKTHTGTLRHLMVRESKTENTIMLMLLVAEKHPEIYQKYATHMAETFKEVVSIYSYFNPEKGDTPKKIDCTLLHGVPHITEKLGNIQYTISPLSFFQTNTQQAEILYTEIKNACLNLQTHLELPAKNLLDLYCGTGSIGLFLAEYMPTILGIEEIPQAIENAKQNAKANNISNTTFICGTVKKGMESLDFAPDIIITDPPRSGMNPKDLAAMIAFQAKGILYVSCNPMTLGRDLDILIQNGYRLQSVQPVDMFPHTFHIECIAQLIKTTG